MTTQTSTPIIEPTNTSNPTAIPLPTPMGGGTGRLIFTYVSYFKNDYFEGGYHEEDFPNLQGKSNIFISNWDGTDLHPVTNGLGAQNFAENISSDGSQVLVSSFGEGIVGYSNSTLYQYLRQK